MIRKYHKNSYISRTDRRELRKALRKDGTLFYPGKDKPHFYKHGNLWYCFHKDTPNTIPGHFGAGETTREAFADWKVWKDVHDLI